MGAVTNGISVLIVEDERRIFRAIKTNLESVGYNVVDARSGQWPSTKYARETPISFLWTWVCQT